MLRVAGLAGWFIQQALRWSESEAALRSRLLALGDWLLERDYIGRDVRADNPLAEISTVAGAAMVGWVNLHALTGDPLYREHADACRTRLLASRNGEGVWPFPYAFRRNPPGHVYACETLMTLRALLAYSERLQADPETLAAVVDGVTYLLARIGHEGGVFWYSATDHIRVPNISSMAANVLARAGDSAGRPEWVALARELAAYCLSQQRGDGAYPYEEGRPFVYIPYHALETWELAEANAVLRDPAIADSAQRALAYLRGELRRGYASYDNDHDGHRQELFKTAIWSAKAFLTLGDLDAARQHLVRGMRRHRAPGRADYVYRLNRRRFGPLTVTFPALRTGFVRYDASCFEIGTRLLLASRGTSSIETT